jgi:hypothetical protein
MNTKGSQMSAAADKQTGWAPYPASQVVLAGRVARALIEALAI